MSVELNTTNTFLSETRTIISENKNETYPGQNQELLNMALVMGCDIHEHVPTLVRYGQKVDNITEMGVRYGWSTRSFLFARPRKLTSVDKYLWGSIHPSGAVAEPGNAQYFRYKKLYEGVVEFIYVQKDTTKMDPIDETELLFIDTWHHRDCLKIELEKHGNKATRYIILHDTETNGECGNAGDGITFFEQPTTNEPGTGLWYAINPFLKSNPHWSIKEIYTNNHGLTVLERSGGII